MVYGLFPLLYLTFQCHPTEGRLNKCWIHSLHLPTDVGQCSFLTPVSSPSASTSPASSSSAPVSTTSTSCSFIKLLLSEASIRQSHIADHTLIHRSQDDISPAMLELLIHLLLHPLRRRFIRNALQEFVKLFRKGELIFSRIENCNAKVWQAGRRLLEGRTRLPDVE